MVLVQSFLGREQFWLHELRMKVAVGRCEIVVWFYRY